MTAPHTGQGGSAIISGETARFQVTGCPESRQKGSPEVPGIIGRLGQAHSKREQGATMPAGNLILPGLLKLESSNLLVPEGSAPKARMWGEGRWILSSSLGPGTPGLPCWPLTVVVLGTGCQREPCKALWCGAQDWFQCFPRKGDKGAPLHSSSTPHPVMEPGGENLQVPWRMELGREQLASGDSSPVQDPGPARARLASLPTWLPGQLVLRSHLWASREAQRQRRDSSPVRAEHKAVWGAEEMGPSKLRLRTLRRRPGGPEVLVPALLGKRH
ncbi:uncharacterized protein LOC117285885 [Fukomys damarensis]|uniref:uncharacterized protein LOC117285885 n=1 Tax=Fukomys damarensis TaxID=885580 RepID=UPI001455B690|nr:uncharacterized protein LOC117285885 [Fukomys damarensis]